MFSEWRFSDLGLEVSKSGIILHQYRVVFLIWFRISRNLRKSQEMIIQKRLLFLALVFFCMLARNVALGQTQDGSTVLTLSEALKLAQNNRASLVSAQNALQASLALKRALSAYPATTFTLGDATHPDLQQGEDLLLTQPIDLFGKYRSGGKVGAAGVSKAMADLKAAQFSTQTEVIKALAQAASAEKLVSLGRKELEIAQTLYDGTVKRVEARDLPPIQQVRAQLGLDTAKAALELRLSQRTAAIQQLSGALGVQVSADQSLEMPTLLPPAVKLDERADLKGGLAAIQAARAVHMTDSLASLPDFEVQARRSFWSLPEQYGLQFQMTWKFWDHGAARNQIKADSFSILAAEATYQDSYRRANADLASAKALYEGASVAAHQYDLLQTSAAQLLAKTQKAFELGGASLLDVLDAEQAYQQVEENQISASLNTALAAADYYQAAGDLILNS